jgi:hypothetical protein
MRERQLLDGRFLALLTRIDENSAERVRLAGCPFCGGTLHQAHYQRKPRGLGEVSAAFCKRYSFSCGREGCRRRVVPPSVRFMGRHVYPAALVTLSCALRQGLTQRRCKALWRLFGVARKTLLRWGRWWKETFPATKFWNAHRGMLVPPPRDVSLPGALLERLRGQDDAERLIKFLQFVHDGALEAQTM